jgi:hypothetical protein
MQQLRRATNSRLRCRLDQVSIGGSGGSP